MIIVYSLTKQHKDQRSSGRKAS